MYKLAHLFRRQIPLLRSITCHFSSPPFLANISFGLTKTLEMEESLVLTESDASDWSYRGEGGANLVLEYTGSSPSFIGKVLRLPKLKVAGAASGASVTSALSEHERRLWEDVEEIATADSREVAGRMFALRVMRPMLGPKHVDTGMRVMVTREFLLSVENSVVDQRPAWRIDAAKVDVQCDHALLISDHSIFQEERSSCIAVEIKPKCGFLPSSEFILKGHSAKTLVSRFKMHQVFKLHEGQIIQMSEYDPIDLFSGSRNMIKQAIKALFATPQNNIRVFLNGSIIFGSLGDIEENEFAKDAYEKNQVFEDSLKDIIQAAHGQRVPTLQDLIAETIFRSDILNQLLQIQKLDKIDIEGAIHAYYNIISESCLVCKNLNDSDLFPEYSVLHSMTLEESAKIVKEYMIAATAKDLSLIISFKPTGLDIKTTNYDSVFLESTKQTFDYKASFIDLDMKPLKKMIYYYELDKKIADLYARIAKIEESDNNPTSSLSVMFVDVTTSYKIS